MAVRLVLFPATTAGQHLANMNIWKENRLLQVAKKEGSLLELVSALLRHLAAICVNYFIYFHQVLVGDK